MNATIDTMIIGAGPYGLSLAAHLGGRGADFRIFGRPMETWRCAMPRGMALKSDGFASSLSAPGGAGSLRDHCAQHGVPYHDTGLPVSLETFTTYALAFQQQFVPSLDEGLVVRLEPAPEGFRATLEDGETLIARNAVVATGISHFAYRPEPLEGLPATLATHASAHHDLSGFSGREVVILGGGSSAVDLAALLHEAGASVRLTARGRELRFFSEPSGRPPSVWRRLRHPASGIGPGLRSRLYADAPGLFRRLPARVRLDIVRRHLGPASAWHVKPRVVGKVDIRLGHTLTAAQARGERVELTFATEGGGSAVLEADHVIAATGYRPDLRRLPFLAPALREQVRSVANTPSLSADFETSVPGLYFMGPAAAGSFGPLMRFMFGADYAVRRIDTRLARRAA
jgi:cation diffusion facilitator CzcD-associated flavoprotein CzcO